MSESCPLSGGQMSLDIPNFCEEKCAALWDEAIKKHQLAGEYDVYRYPDDFDEPEACSHNGGLDNSHDALQSVDSTSIRVYTTVDECSGCGTEYGEQGYWFTCPYNEMKIDNGEN